MYVGDHVERAGILFRKDFRVKSWGTFRDVLESVETADSWMRAKRTDFTSPVCSRRRTGSHEKMLKIHEAHSVVSHWHPCLL
jgi:hypothetical protein